MRFASVRFAIFAFSLLAPLHAQTSSLLSKASDPTQVDFELMTWPELKGAIHEQGKTTVLVFNGGTEQRGPQNVAGGHTFIARATAVAIAKKLGNAIVAPVLPFSINRANAELPGTIGISGPVFAELNEQVAEQLISNGFKNVVLMGDHGGGQKELAEVAKKLDAKYSPQGAHVFFCDDVYEKANNAFNQWLAEHGYPASSHAGIPDTSEMLYLEGNQKWVREDLLPIAVGNPVRKPGEPRDPNARRINNGISGDARRSTAELGKQFIDLKVQYAVEQIQHLVEGKQPTTASR
jgi:creatinine amidohydrolase